MTSCEMRKCVFWNGQNCTDTEEYINVVDGEPCCRYHSNAMTKQEFDEYIGIKEATRDMWDSEDYY